MKKQIESVNAMKAWAEQVGALLNGGEFIELIGDVGAGKTTFTKGLAIGLGIEETVQSPTFTISRLYDGRNGIRLAHYDFYRLSNAGIMADELAETTQDENTVVVIEWGDVVSDVRPDDYMQIHFESPTENDRIVTVNAVGPNHTMLLEKMRNIK